MEYENKLHNELRPTHARFFFYIKITANEMVKFCIIDAVSAQKQLWIHISILRLYE